jgi:GMP synthase-like glutamine amidotransferase
MRALFIRFLDCEGPGILEPILREQGYRISYHNAYDKRLQIMPEAHLNFDFIAMLGGPMSVTDPKMDSFFRPYLELAENMIITPGRKLLGICLGSQIIAKALGADVYAGDKGPEVGFAPVELMDRADSVFQGITSSHIQAFHLHEDTFALPHGAKHLLSSNHYPNQMFSYENNAYALQTHLEPTLSMLQVWLTVHKEFISQGKGDFTDLAAKQSEMEKSVRVVFQNIINI